MSIYVRGRQKDAGLVQGKPPRGVGEGGLASQLTQLKPLDYFVWGVSELLSHAKPRNKIKDLIQRLKVVVGYLERGTVVKAY
jgi:hypothetical protein